jgi:hypothetical protein
VLVILSKKVYMYMCSIPNGSGNRMISLYRTLYRRATCHVLTQDAKCIDVDGGIFENVVGKLYQLCHLNNKYRYYKQYVMSLSYQQFWNCTVK